MVCGLRTIVVFLFVVILQLVVLCCFKQELRRWKQPHERREREPRERTPQAGAPGYSTTPPAAASCVAFASATARRNAWRNNEGWVHQPRVLKSLSWRPARALPRLRLAAFAQRVIVQRKRLELRLAEPAKRAVAKEGNEQALARRPRGAGRLTGAVRVGHLPRPARVALHACPHQVTTRKRHGAAEARHTVPLRRAPHPRGGAASNTRSNTGRHARAEEREEVRGWSVGFPPVPARPRPRPAAPALLSPLSDARLRVPSSAAAAPASSCKIPLPVLLNIGSALSAIFWPHAAAASTSGAAAVAGGANAAKDASVAGAAASGSSAAATGAKVRRRRKPRTRRAFAAFAQRCAPSGWLRCNCERR